MKKMLALALVGLLSISSLAEAKKDTQASAKSKTVQRGPSSAELNCIDGFVNIKGSGAIKDFCISEKVEEKTNLGRARSNCEGKASNNSNNREVHLCTIREWKLACEQKKPVLGMGQDFEWVADLDYFDIPIVMGNERCDNISKDSNVFRPRGSRCCYN
jgi:hypothetical protein